MRSFPQNELRVEEHTNIPSFPWEHVPIWTSDLWRTPVATWNSIYKAREMVDCNLHECFMLVLSIELTFIKLGKTIHGLESQSITRLFSNDVFFLFIYLMCVCRHAEVGTTFRHKFSLSPRLNCSCQGWQQKPFPTKSPQQPLLVLWLKDFIPPGIGGAHF